MSTQDHPTGRYADVLHSLAEARLGAEDWLAWWEQKGQEIKASAAGRAAGMTKTWCTANRSSRPTHGQPPPPAYFDRGQTASIARWLAARPFSEMVAAVDPAEVRDADLYSVGCWDEQDRDFVVHYGERLAAFFATAAAANDAVIMEVQY